VLTNIHAFVVLLYPKTAGSGMQKKNEDIKKTMYYCIQVRKTG
jgi:hypothetical protein